MEKKKTTAARRVKLSEMSDLELKEYYKIQKEERERRKRIQEEIKREEFIQELEDGARKFEEWRKENKETCIKTNKDLIKENRLGLIGLIGLYILMLMIFPPENIITGIVILTIFIGPFVILVKHNNDEARRDIRELETL